MPEPGALDLEILMELDKKVQRLEDKATAIRKEIGEAVKEGELRAQLILMNAPELAANVPDRYRPRGTERGSQVELATTPARPRSTGTGRQSRRKPRGRTPRVSHEEMVDWCRTILRDEGREMHVSEIREKLERNPDWRVPGQGTDSNVSVHLARSGEFESGDARGMWRLTGGQVS